MLITLLFTLARQSRLVKMDSRTVLYLVSVLFTLLLTENLCVCRHTAASSNRSGHRLRHSSSRNAADRHAESGETKEQSAAMQGIQREILDNLGLERTPNVHNVDIPEHMREILREEIASESTEIKEDTHFMADSANILQTATQVHTEEFGETIQFTLNRNDRAVRMVEIKLYYHINPMDVTMTDSNSAEPMKLTLSQLKKDQNGTLVSEVVDDSIQIHSHLIGWHNEEIPVKLVRRAFQASQADQITLQFQLVCTNCIYRLFPEVTTKQNVPFLTMNGRRRSRRNGQRGCNGGCCLRELIVDFNALGPAWDFVIYPRRYQANYCAGSCQRPSPSDRASMTSNTNILNMILSRQRAAATSSCCVAADEERILLAYYVDGGAVRTTNDAIKKIKSCRCV